MRFVYIIRYKCIEKNNVSVARGNELSVQLIAKKIHFLFQYKGKAILCVVYFKLIVS